MAEILQPKVSAIGLVDIFGLGVSKNATEKILAPIVGNGTQTSGIIKLVIGSLVYGKAGRVGNMVSGGLVVDGTEDIVNALMPSVAASPTAENW